MVEEEKKQEAQQGSMSLYDFNKICINGIESYNFQDIRDRLESYLKQVIYENIDSNYFVLMSPHFNYCTFFVRKTDITTLDFVNEILNFIEEEIESNSLPPIKDFSLKGQDSCEIWFGNEYYHFFNYKFGVIEL